MDAATTNTAAVVLRLLRRALIVLGGTVAGTAIAWVVSAACASAETPHGESALSEVPVVERLVGAPATRPVVQPLAPRQVVQPLSDVVDVVERVVPSVADLEHDAHRAADGVGQQLAGEVSSILRVPPGVDDAGGSVHSGAHPAPGGAPGLASPARSVDQPAAASHTATDKSIVDVPAARGATGRALDGVAGRGSSEPAPGTPFGPGMPGRAAVPASGSGSSMPAGGGADSPTAAALCFATNPSDPTSGRTRSAADVDVLDELGTAPGVTPD